MATNEKKDDMKFRSYFASGTVCWSDFGQSVIFCRHWHAMIASFSAMFCFTAHRVLSLRTIPAHFNNDSLSILNEIFHVCNRNVTIYVRRHLYLPLQSHWTNLNVLHRSCAMFSMFFQTRNVFYRQCSTDGSMKSLILPVTESLALRAESLCSSSSELNFQSFSLCFTEQIRYSERIPHFRKET